jgi:CRISPR system Cascade subunit CasE
MFLSRLPLNARDRQGRFDLARPYEMHRTLWRAFPEGDPGRVLYRVDADRRDGRPAALVQSDHEPHWERLPTGYLVEPAECKALDFQVAAGQRLRFRLRANPTKRVAAKNERLGGVMVGKRVGLTTEADQLRWLLRKGEEGGFRIPGQWVQSEDPRTGQPRLDVKTGKPLVIPNFRVDVVPEGRIPNGKPGHGGAFLAVRFEGSLVVTDPDVFRQTFADGIGTGKAFGFGLLSVAPERA